jgi:hypothetical protein
LYEVPYDAAVFGKLPDITAGEAPLNIRHKGLQQATQSKTPESE